MPRAATAALGAGLVPRFLLLPLLLLLTLPVLPLLRRRRQWLYPGNQGWLCLQHALGCWGPSQSCAAGGSPPSRHPAAGPKGPATRRCPTTLGGRSGRGSRRGGSWGELGAGLAGGCLGRDAAPLSTLCALPGKLSRRRRAMVAGEPALAQQRL
jgi:hypothetical protein